MNVYQTPPKAKRAKIRSPTIRLDGISLDANHLERQETVEAIYNTAIQKKYVVVGSSAATGKSSLLQLLEAKLEEENSKVVWLPLHAGEPIDKLNQRLQEEGIPRNVNKLKRESKDHKTWLLIDDAQNNYSEQYNGLWQFLVKEISNRNIPNFHVVIAATYDLETSISPVVFTDIPHIDPNISKDEAVFLVSMFAEEWGIKSWNDYLQALFDISRFTGTDTDKYHIGVIMAGIRLLDEFKAQPGNKEAFRHKESEVLSKLRGNGFYEKLKRCFGSPEGLLSDDFKAKFLDILLSPQNSDNLSNTVLGPAIRAGILKKDGSFSTYAAWWFYNQNFFPNRATAVPESLDQLVVSAVQSISAKRLRDACVNGFPKEAAFQHLFNEALSLHLPAANMIVPELNTFAAHPNNPTQIVTGELDFYVNGELKWALELVRLGSKIGEHVARFDKHTGKYRTVIMNDFLVVDCRGPKNKAGAKLEDSKCTLYFANDFKTCECQMRNENSFVIHLAT